MQHLQIQHPNGLTIQCVDGGWFVIFPGPEGHTMVSCRTAQEVLGKVIEWLGDQSLPLQVWDVGVPICQPNTTCLLSEVPTAGTGATSWVITYAAGPPPHPQFVRFNPTDVVILAARWLGYVPREAPSVLDTQG